MRQTYIKSVLGSMHGMCVSLNLFLGKQSDFIVLVKNVEMNHVYYSSVNVQRMLLCLIIVSFIGV